MSVFDGVLESPFIHLFSLQSTTVVLIPYGKELKLLFNATSYKVNLGIGIPNFFVHNPSCILRGARCGYIILVIKIIVQLVSLQSWQLIPQLIDTSSPDTYALRYVLRSFFDEFACIQSGFIIQL